MFTLEKSGGETEICSLLWSDSNNDSPDWFFRFQLKSLRHTRVR